MMQVNGSDALKQAFVQLYVVGMFGQQRLHFLSQGIHLVARLRSHQVEECGRHA